MGVKKYPKDKFVPARRMNDKAVGLYDRVTKSFFANAGTGAFLAPGDPPPRGRRWTLARAREWGRANPWYCGFNHVPANAINDVEIWAKETFSPDLIRSEFKLATGLGFNCVRIFLQYKVYEADPVWFREAFERYVKLADEAKLKVMPVLFDDCSFWPATDPQLGKQTDPLPGWGMWGWVPSPGHTMVVDYRTHGALEKYVKDIISRYKDDPRIFIWDLYNEPTNSMRLPRLRKYSIDLMHKCFRWARETAPSQPLTVACFRPVDPVFDKIAMAESDIITFHFYGTRRRDSQEDRGNVRCGATDNLHGMALPSVRLRRAEHSLHLQGDGNRLHVVGACQRQGADAPAQRRVYPEFQRPVETRPLPLRPSPVQREGPRTHPRRHPCRNKMTERASH